MQQRTTHATEDWRILQSVFRDTLHDEVKLSAKARTKAGSLLFVPILRSDDVCPRSWREEDRQYYGQRRPNSACRLSQGIA